MTAKEKDQLMEMYKEHDYKCFLCPKQATQRAHIIGNTLLNRKLYGKRILDNPLNWLPTCNLDHNNKIDLGRNGILKERVALVIDSHMDYSEKKEAIEAIVKENIKRKECKIGKVL